MVRSILQPGLAWHGDVQVLDLEELAHGRRAHIHRVRSKEVRFPPLAQLSFPAKEARELRLSADLHAVLNSKIDLAPIIEVDEGNDDAGGNND